MAKIKAKYKIDSVVETANNEEHGVTEGFGRVTGVTQTKDGFTYTVAGHAKQIEEAWIVGAYNQSKARAPRGSKTPRTQKIGNVVKGKSNGRADSVQETTLE